MAQEVAPKLSDGSEPTEATGTPDEDTGKTPLLPLTEADHQRWLNARRKTRGDAWVEANLGMLEASWERLKDF
jgi:hypothetical protein